MTEQALKDYFEGKLSASGLSHDVRGSQVRTGHDTTSIHVVPIAGEGEFRVKRAHMLMLCNDTIAGHLSMEDLNTIGFALMSSDHFTLNDGSVDGKIVSETAFDWDNPGIGYDLTPENMQPWKTRLETGANTFDRNELRGKGQ